MRQQKNRIAVVALALGATLGTAGCATGQLAHTAQELPAVNGGMARVGKIAIRDASLVYPAEAEGVYAKGSDVELALTIVSRKTPDDKLVKVASKAASDVAYEGSRVLPGGGTLVVGLPARAGEGGAQPGEATPDLEGASHARVVLQDITVPVRSGQSLQVALTFEEAGTVTVNMPVATPAYEEGVRESGGSHGESGGSHGGGSGGH